jgi:hypothetical protein
MTNAPDVSGDVNRLGQVAEANSRSSVDRVLSLIHELRKELSGPSGENRYLQIISSLRAKK